MSKPETPTRRIRAGLAARGRLGVVLVATVLLLGAAGRATADGACSFGTERSPLAPTLESYRLDNGLRVHLVPRAEAATLSVRVGYDVGAQDEPEGRGGVAHLFEHMMFKGSMRVPDGGHFRLVRDVGGRTNAVTDYDSTQYWNTVPSDALERVLFAEADRMRSLRIDRARLDNQRAAIREEGLGLENLPYVAAATAFGLELWAGTPYGHSPIGTPAELEAMTAEAAAAFHARYYTPGNAVLVIVGGFDPERVRPAIERTFGAIPPGETRPGRGAWELDRRPRRHVARDPLAPFPVFAAVWQTIGTTRDEAPAVAVLDDLLMGHVDARLMRRVARPLAIDAYAVSLAFRDVGLLNYVFVPRTFVSVDEIRDALRESTRRLRSEGPGEAETCRSIARERAERLARLETHEGLAAAIARGALFANDPLAFERELDALAALDPKALRDVARRYLVEAFHTLEIRPTGVMGWLKPLLEWLPDGVGASLEESLL